ncbi:putative NADH-dependent flavin oxidoreductase [Streptomyces sp. NBRC 110611]|uniref:flavin reductase family protein n=1 Tax=Streptomyces sp. NBRC 110611 TaxID=1621259 RepID=UPI00082BA2F8|nr:flavin reductase family protein [Streptomyces sp. NBRC 110611]GAU65800.1 putative NADH-dependent flavin oxidoreductase [Streptomyces sp. NBRC 110611]
MTDEFKDVMARFPTGVAIVTTCDEAGEPHGLTVSSFCSVSLDPPLVLICVAKSARCFPAFERGGEFAVSILRRHHTELARRFATSTAGKFAGGGFTRTQRGGVIVEDALAALECLVDARHDAGDHVILVGKVVDQTLADRGTPAVYVDRTFATISSAR